MSFSGVVRARPRIFGHDRRHKPMLCVAPLAYHVFPFGLSSIFWKPQAFMFLVRFDYTSFLPFVSLAPLFQRASTVFLVVARTRARISGYATNLKLCLFGSVRAFFFCSFRPSSFSCVPRAAALRRGTCARTQFRSLHKPEGIISFVEFSNSLFCRSFRLSPFSCPPRAVVCRRSKCTRTHIVFRLSSCQQPQALIIVARFSDALFLLDSLVPFLFAPRAVVRRRGTCTCAPLPGHATSHKLVFLVRFGYPLFFRSFRWPPFSYVRRRRTQRLNNTCCKS